MSLSKTLALVLCTLWSSVAAAAEVAVVGIHDAALDRAEQERLADALVAAIEADGRLEAWGPDRMARALSGREDLVLQAAFQEDGQRMLEDGRILYQQAQVDDAVFVLEAAVQELDAAVEHTGRVRSLWEAWMLLATARLGQGQEVGARDAVAAALALQPDRRPDPATYPPSILELHESERELATDDPAQILVTVPVEGGAMVSVDGRELGRSPLEVDALVPGVHHLHVVTDDGERGYLRVDVPPGDATRVELPVAPPVLGAPAERVAARSQQVRALYKALGSLSEADLLLLAGRVDDVMHLQLAAPDIDAFSEPVVLSAIGDETELVEGLTTLLADVSASGRLPPSDTVFVPLGLDVSANRLLADLLLVPATFVQPLPAPTPVTPDPAEPTDVPDEPAPTEKPKWPLYVGIGAGAAVLAAGVTALAVVLGGQGGDDDAVGGTLTIGPPRTP